MVTFALLDKMLFFSTDSTLVALVFIRNDNIRREKHNGVQQQSKYTDNQVRLSTLAWLNCSALPKKQLKVVTWIFNENQNSNISTRQKRVNKRSETHNLFWHLINGGLEWTINDAYESACILLTSGTIYISSSTKSNSVDIPIPKKMEKEKKKAKKARSVYAKEEFREMLTYV